LIIQLSNKNSTSFYMMSKIPSANIRAWYDQFDSPVVPIDCGLKCSPHNASGKPFCCDICHAVPSAYHQEWFYLQASTDLWHLWRGDECTQNPEDPTKLAEDTPETMQLVACLGPAYCQRRFRSLSCRQFPFFPYITVEYGFIGLAYNWEFEESCWVISHLNRVTLEYHLEFVEFYDEFFSTWPHELDHYAARSEEMRQVFISQNRSIPILYREGGVYLLRPLNERLRPVEPDRLPKFGPYRSV
jgi:hypothetical protein